MEKTTGVSGGSGSKGSSGSGGDKFEAVLNKHLEKEQSSRNGGKGGGESTDKSVGSETNSEKNAEARTGPRSEKELLDILSRYGQTKATEGDFQEIRLASATAQAPQWGFPTYGAQPAPQTGIPNGQPGPSISEPAQPLNGANDNKSGPKDTGPRNWIDRISESVVSRGLTALGATGLLASSFLVAMTKKAGAETSTSHEFASGGKLDFSSSASAVEASYTGKDQSTYKVGTKFDHDSKTHLFSSAEQKQADGSFKTLDQKNWPQDLQDHKGVIYQNGKIDLVPKQGMDKPEDPKPVYEKGHSTQSVEEDLTVKNMQNQGKSDAEIQRAIENVRGGEASNLIRKTPLTSEQIEEISALDVHGVRAQRILPGDNGKVAVIGRSMGRVEERGEYGVVDYARELRERGYDTELFASQQIKNEWREEINKLRAMYKVRFLPDEVVKTTEFYKENIRWSEKLREEGYTVIDIGNPNNKPDIGPFYGGELQETFDKVDPSKIIDLSGANQYTDNSN